MNKAAVEVTFILPSSTDELNDSSLLQNNNNIYAFPIN